jgi:hypothetical protein
MVWLISKSLNTNLSITDGGPYSLMDVTYFKEGKVRKKELVSNKKPCLNILSSYYKYKYKYKYKNHSSLKLGPLGNIPWDKYF